MLDSVAHISFESLWSVFFPLPSSPLLYFFSLYQHTVFFTFLPVYKDSLRAVCIATFWSWQFAALALSFCNWSPYYFFLHPTFSCRIKVLPFPGYLILWISILGVQMNKTYLSYNELYTEKSSVKWSDSSI